MEQHFCQSCAMPLSEEFKSYNADGSVNEDYCSYCYQDGQFAQDCTMDEMIDHCLQFLSEFNEGSGKEFTLDEARHEMRQYFPMLKRWQA